MAKYGVFSDPYFTVYVQNRRFVFMRGICGSEKTRILTCFTQRCGLILTLSTNPTKWSNTLKQFVGNSNSRRIVWVCLTILWVALEGLKVKMLLLPLEFIWIMEWQEWYRLCCFLDKKTSWPFVNTSHLNQKVEKVK